MTDCTLHPGELRRSGHWSVGNYKAAIYDEPWLASSPTVGGGVMDPNDRLLKLFI